MPKKADIFKTIDNIKKLRDRFELHIITNKISYTLKKLIRPYPRNIDFP